MNMPLFVNDIKAIGCSCECVCASRNKLGDLTEYLKKKEFDLIAVDYTFLGVLTGVTSQIQLSTGLNFPVSSCPVKIEVR